MSNWSPTQIIVLVVSAFIGIFATLVFAGIIPWFGGSNEFGGEVVMWGDILERDIRPVLDEFNKKHEKEFQVVYLERRKENFNNDLVEAIASGVGPDIILLPQELILKQENKIFPIPFDSFSLRGFRDMFVEIGELYVIPDGILGIPLLIDPFVMYWNRDILSSSGIAIPPKKWDELLVMAPRISKIANDTREVNQSAAALGEFSNISNAKAILSSLFLQTGDKISERKEDGSLLSVLGEFRSGGISAAESSIRFYTEFSNPLGRAYSWNRSLPEARRAFIGNTLAMYFGFASEFDDIVDGNSHLNFDVAKLPQIRGQAAEKTFATSIAAAVMKTSGNPTTSFRVVFAMLDKEFLLGLSEASGLVPSRRDMLLEEDSVDPYVGVFNSSSIIGRGWLDPDEEKTRQIFQNMTENITSGRQRENEAVNRARGDLEKLLNQ